LAEKESVKTARIAQNLGSRYGEATIVIPKLFELHAEPIKNPVTGEEHRAQIHLPNGLEYRYAEVGNTTHLTATMGDKRIEHANTYAQFNAFDWNNKDSP
jgi:hypothetical protein